LREALLMVEEEGLAERQSRHERNHLALVAGIEAMGLSLLPPEVERLWTLNAVRMPAGVDEAAVRRTMLTTSTSNRRRPGPLAGKIWRGPDGRQPTHKLAAFLAARGALATHGHRVPEGAGVAALPRRRCVPRARQEVGPARRLKRVTPAGECANSRES
jgi:alanine-glyoxylate transaminase/serine-glyoxylate transaminase/serine-pyruvate transaminase